MKQNILVINGPNLNLLGLREPHVYGNQTLNEIVENLQKEFTSVNFEFFQSNNEGDLVDTVQKAVGKTQFSGLIINAGGYTHTSVALRDAVAALDIPAIEVHLSNIYARESFRHHSMLSPIVDGVICGLGATGYSLAVQAILSKISKDTL